MRTPVRLTTAIIAAAACAVGLAALAGCGSLATSTASAGGQPAGSGSSSAAVGATGTASSTAAAFPLTVQAGDGAVTLKSYPTRIVSLDPTSTEDLYAVGAGKQVVAVDQDSNYPAGIPKTGLSGLTPNIEAIARYNPSLVVSSQDSGGLVARLKKLGVPVLVEPAVTTLGAAYAQIEQVGQATGHGAQAASVVAGMKRQIAASVMQAGTNHSNLSYYWEVSANPYYSATSTTFIGQVAGLFGLKNIADRASKASDGGYPELSQEYIVTARPQIIFLADNQASDGGQSPAIVAKRPGWSGVPAVQQGDVFGLNDDVASRWGPRLPELVGEIARAVEQASK
ncbi:MAG: ABC transporter substrate-binding protein [Trebonia sp.]